MLYYNRLKQAKSQNSQKYFFSNKKKDYDEKKVGMLFSSLVLFQKSFHKSEQSLKTAISELPIDQSKKVIIESIALENFELLKTTLHENMIQNEAEYSDLEWRFDIEISNRAKNSCFKPNFMYKLKLKDGKDHDAYIDFNSDYSNAKNMLDELENIKAYMKSISYRKLSNPFIKMK